MGWYRYKNVKRQVISQGKLVTKFPNDPIVYGRFVTVKIYYKKMKSKMRLYSHKLLDHANYDSQRKRTQHVLEKGQTISL